MDTKDEIDALDGRLNALQMAIILMVHETLGDDDKMRLALCQRMFAEASKFERNAHGYSRAYAGTYPAELREIGAAIEPNTPDPHQSTH